MLTIQTRPKLLERLKDGIEEPFSWIDLFFVADIYMIGLGLLYDEIDLWWVLTRRKRLIRQGYDIKNRIFYCGNVETRKEILFATMGVEVIKPDAAKGDYMGQYMSLIDKIKRI